MLTLFLFCFFILFVYRWMFCISNFTVANFDQLTLDLASVMAGQDLGGEGARAPGLPHLGPPKNRGNILRGCNSLWCRWACPPPKKSCCLVTYFQMDTFLANIEGHKFKICSSTSASNMLTPPSILFYQIF